ncbi:helix-turn-helix domain-containing protein [Microbacterium sp.]|uniref:helix-turn-helix domain-containing protein n=1 Tax=Microbacterium sp. TaxID=51671 RepID=UPI0039E39383
MTDADLPAPSVTTLHEAQAELWRIVAGDTAAIAQAVVSLAASTLGGPVILVNEHGEEFAYAGRRVPLAMVRTAIARGAESDGVLSRRIVAPSGGGGAGALWYQPEDGWDSEALYLFVSSCVHALSLYSRLVSGGAAPDEIAKPLTLLALAHDIFTPPALKDISSLYDVGPDSILSVAALQFPTPEAAYRASARSGRLTSPEWPKICAAADQDCLLVLLRGSTLTGAAVQAASLTYPNMNGIGLSLPTSDLGSLARAAQQAKRAASLVSHRNPLVRFRDLAPNAELFNRVRLDVARAYVAEQLAPLDSVADAQARDLVKTLRLFIDHDANIADTAQALGCTPEEVRSRIERASTATGRNFFRVKDLADYDLALQWSLLVP